MTSNVKLLLVFGAGFASGWTARSLTESPHDAGVKLVSLAMRTKERVGRWAAVERERLEDVFAEARSNVEPDTKAATKTNGSKKDTNGFGRTPRGEA